MYMYITLLTLYLQFLVSVVTDKPQSLRTTGVQFNQVEVSWYAPVIERNITGFTLVLSDVITGDVSRETLTPVSDHVLTELEPDRPYTLTVTSLLGEEGKTSDVLEFKTAPYSKH